MANLLNNRIIYTPSSYVKQHYFYVQEAGSLQSTEPHISKREHLSSLLFFIVKKGSGTICYQSKKIHISTGDCIFLDCKTGYSHESSLEDPWELSWVHFYGPFAEDTYRNYIEQGGIFCFHPDDLSSFLFPLQAVHAELVHKNAYYELQIHKHLTDLITNCYQNLKPSSTIPPSNTLEKIGTITVYIEEHYADKINLDSLSSLFYVSKYHLAREFKKATGMTIGSYLTAKRINEAKKLLRFSSDSISSIASACGIPDENYFTKVFSKYEGITPSSYRTLW